MRDVVLGFFAGEGIAVAEGEEGDLHVVIPAENARFGCSAHVDEDTGVFVFYTESPLAVPAEQMSRALELVARLNWGHTLGNLELDPDSGAMRFKTSLDVEDAALTEPLVANVVYANVASLDRMMPALAALLEGRTPAEALSTLEGA